MEKGRLEAFSDGVIAIAITLLVLEIKVPVPVNGGLDLPGELAGQWPSYVAYVVSFATIGVVWINHHATLDRIESVDHTLIILNLLLLMLTCVVPWTTALLADYLREPHGGRIASVIYGGSFLLVTATFYLLQRHILFGRGELMGHRNDAAARTRIDRRNRLGLLPYAVASAVGLYSAYLTLAICALIAVYYALPSTVYARSTEQS
jgi:uncharacterized membrane protein